MTGLVPVIHVVKPPESFRIGRKRSGVDDRDKPGHDGKGSLTAQHAFILAPRGSGVGRPPPDALQLITSPQPSSRLNREEPHPRPPSENGEGRRFRDSFPVLSDFKGLRGGNFPFLNCSFVILTARQPESRTAARPCTTSCGFEDSEAIPFPGADSIFSSRCGAISGRFRFCRQALSRRDPGEANASAGRDRTGAPARRGGAAPRHPSPREFGPARSRDSGSVRSSTRSIDPPTVDCPAIMVRATIIASLSPAICN
jgi:hypothetical protein